MEEITQGQDGRRASHRPRNDGKRASHRGRSEPSAARPRSGAELAAEMRRLYRNAVADRLARLEEHRQIGVCWLEACAHAIPKSGKTQEAWAREHLPFSHKWAARCARFVSRSNEWPEVREWWEGPDGHKAGWRTEHNTGVDWALEVFREFAHFQKKDPPDWRELAEAREPGEGGRETVESLRTRLEDAEREAEIAVAEARGYRQEANDLARKLADRHEWEKGLQAELAKERARAERYRQRLIGLGQTVED